MEQHKTQKKTQKRGMEKMNDRRGQLIDIEIWLLRGCYELLERRMPVSAMRGLWGLRRGLLLPWLPRRAEVVLPVEPLITPLAVPALSFLRLIRPGGTGALVIRIFCRALCRVVPGLEASPDEEVGTPNASDKAMVVAGSERMEEVASTGGGRGTPGEGGRDELDDAGPIAGVGQTWPNEDDAEMGLVAIGNGYSNGALAQFVAKGVPTIWSLGEWRMREDMSDILSWGEATREGV